MLYIWKIKQAGILLKPAAYSLNWADFMRHFLSETFKRQERANDGMWAKNFLLWYKNYLCSSASEIYNWTFLYIGLRYQTCEKLIQISSSVLDDIPWTERLRSFLKIGTDTSLYHCWVLQQTRQIKLLLDVNGDHKTGCKLAAILQFCFSAAEASTYRFFLQLLLL